MKITLDTDAKQTICPPDFFENIRKINDAAELTESKSTVTPENYLNKIIKECSKVIVNRNDTTKKRRTSYRNKNFNNNTQNANSNNNTQNTNTNT